MKEVFIILKHKRAKDLKTLKTETKQKIWSTKYAKHFFNFAKYTQLLKVVGKGLHGIIDPCIMFTFGTL